MFYNMFVFKSITFKDIIFVQKKSVYKLVHAFKTHNNNQCSGLFLNHLNQLVRIDSFGNSFSIRLFDETPCIPAETNEFAFVTGNKINFAGKGKEFRFFSQ